jgi:hypothetical protein
MQLERREVPNHVRQKLKRMTILVGIVGSDGIILAADRRMIRPAQNEHEFDDWFGILKIKHSEEHMVAYAAVGDSVSKTVGTKIFTALDTGDFSFTRIHFSLEGIVASAVREAIEEANRQPALSHFAALEDRSLLIVFYGHQVAEPQLWRVSITPVFTAERVSEITVCGAIGNPARLLAHYFTEAAPVQALTFLAAHIVFAATRIDSLVIHGLDLAYFYKAGCRFLDANQKTKLRKQSDELDALIGRQLFLQARMLDKT